MLPAKQSEHPIIDSLFALFDSDHKLQAEKVLVMKIGLCGNGSRRHDCLALGRQYKTRSFSMFSMRSSSGLECVPEKLVSEATFGWSFRSISVTGANVVEPTPRISLLPWMLHHLGLFAALFSRA